MADIPKGLDEYLSTLKSYLDFSAEEWVGASNKLSYFANEVNKSFAQGRNRIVELNQTIAETVPSVIRLGGGIEDVSRIITDVANASRRNVIANEEDVKNLYAATQLLGDDARTLSNAFLDIGIRIESIPEQLETSMEYVRSIGGNTKVVFEDVRQNMDQMNRFQFEGGVRGLTKMAAQASMLRFDMNETFRLADDVLNPERAIEVASAFQRLGVSAGDLVDPFQLMNQSINDPSGLQDSLVDVAKQFTYFDEKTKSFKINPQGVMTLREIQQQTGVSSRELTKMGLAAAELDMRLSAVNAAGLKISSEEDKQFLANIAKLGDRGTYEVTLQDGTKKELAEITQPEFEKLIDEQKKGPKSLEDLARSQLNASELLVYDVKAIREKLIGGTITAGPILQLKEQTRDIVGTITGELSKSFTTKDVRKESETLIKTFETFIKDMNDPKKSGIETLANLFENVGKQGESLQQRMFERLAETTKKIGEDQSSKPGFQKTVGTMFLEGSDFIKNKVIQTNTELKGTISPTTKEAYGEKIKTTGTETSSKTEVLVGGKFTVDLNLPGNFNQLNLEQQQKVIDSIFNSSQFKQYIMDIVKSENKGTKTPVNANYR